MNRERNEVNGALLKPAFWKCGLRYLDVVRATSVLLPEGEQLSEVRLSRIVTGRATPSPEQAAALADVLGCSVEEIFPSFAEDSAGKPDLGICRRQTKARKPEGGKI